MLKKLILAGIASLVLVGGVASAAAPPQHQFHLDTEGAIWAGLWDESIGDFEGLDSGFQKITKNTTTINVTTCTPNCTPFSLDVFWTEIDPFPNGVRGHTCFFPVEPLFDEDGNTLEHVVEVQGAIQISKTRDGGAQARFWFGAGPNDKVWYMLTLTAPVWTDGNEGVGTFPPPNKSDKAVMVADAWEMETEGKGKDRYSPCKGTGTFDEGEGVILTITRIN